MKRAIQRATILATTLLLAGVGMSTTAAGKPGGVTEPSPNATVAFEAGEPCAFPVLVEPIEDDFSVTTWPEKPNGDVVQVYSGHAIALATNLTSGDTLRFDNSGPLYAVFHADGSADVRYGAPSVLWNLAEEPGRDGLWVLKRGSASEAYDQDFNLIGQRLPGGGALLDLCAALG
jgi:hypothetical protein